MAFRLLGVAPEIPMRLLTSTSTVSWLTQEKTVAIMNIIMARTMENMVTRVIINSLCKNSLRQFNSTTQLTRIAHCNGV